MLEAALAGLRTGKAWLSALPQIVVVLLVTLPLTFLLGQCDGKHSERARNDAARAAANVETIQKDGNAKEIAANERLTDQALNDEHKKELLDAIQSAPDSAPDASRVAFGCQRLRAAGRDEASLPSVCRPESGTQAGAH
jgi:hypothetical protein